MQAAAYQDVEGDSDKWSAAAAATATVYTRKAMWAVSHLSRSQHLYSSRARVLLISFRLYSYAVIGND